MQTIQALLKRYMHCLRKDSPKQGFVLIPNRMMTHNLTGIIYEARPPYQLTPPLYDARINYLVENILTVCGDQKSYAYYRRVAQVLPTEVIFRFLAELKADKKVCNRGAVFTSKVKAYFARKVSAGHGP